AVAGRDVISRLVVPYRCDRGLGAHGRIRERAVARDERDNLADAHIAVRIRPLVAIARQTALPVRREEPQRIPAFVPPGIRYLSALEDDLVDRSFGQTPAGGEAGMPGADHDGRDVFDGSAPAAVSRGQTTT